MKGDRLFFLVIAVADSVLALWCAFDGIYQGFWGWAAAAVLSVIVAYKEIE
jgi:hypothetical protein